tara:strand:- start:104 stop:475 length:372 start_codon:yes stop_codon:yes gene_type:complete
MKNLKEQYTRFFGSLNEAQDFKGRITPDIARQIAKMMVSRGSKDKMTYSFDLVAAGRFTNGMSKRFRIGHILRALGVDMNSPTDAVYLDDVDIVRGDKTIGNWTRMSKGDFFKFLKKKGIIRF